jgi:hypothetical protein
MNEFEKYVAEWDSLVGQIEQIKKQLKPLTDKEMEMRKSIHSSVCAALGDNLKEGTNTYTMPSGRKLKIVNNFKREIEVSMIPTAREAFSKLNDTSVSFDQLLRVKYELEKRAWSSLSDAAKRAVSTMISTRPDTPQISLD